MKLTDLKPVAGSVKQLRRVGRGIASGMGKTSTRGHRGQGQRSGYKRRFGFEGGQTPLFRRLPKIHNFGFRTTRDWVSLNVSQLNHLPANTEVTPETLVEHKILRQVTKSLRILGHGELKVALKVKAHHVSAGAIEKIEKAGGKVDVIQPAPRKRGRLPKVKNPATHAPAEAKPKKKAADEE
jgi:ribosomal protein L15, bacterial/organelle